MGSDTPRLTTILVRQKVKLHLLAAFAIGNVRAHNTDLSWGNTSFHQKNEQWSLILKTGEKLYNKYLNM